MPSGWYNRGVYTLATGYALDGATVFKGMLLKTTYAFDRDHVVVADVVAHELTAAGYLRQTVGNRVVTQNDIKDATYWDADNVAFGPMVAGETARFFAIFLDTSDDATSPLLACWQIVDYPTDGGVFTFEVSPSGLTKLWSAT